MSQLRGGKPTTPTGSAEQVEKSYPKLPPGTNNAEKFPSMFPSRVHS